MRAVEIYPEFGIDNLRIAEREEPAPGPDEVKIRVRAISLNYRDFKTVEGVNYPSIDLPRIPCSDGAGEVVEIGSGVKGVNVGEKVVALFMPEWIDGSLTPEIAASSQGGLDDGMATEYRVLPSSAVLPIPDHLSVTEAATLPCAGLTAWNAIFENRPLRKEHTVLVRGTGGVAMFAFQFAKALGCRVLATSSNPAKIEKLRAMEASAVCNYKDTDWVEWAIEQTEGKGVDFVVDPVGGQALEESVLAARMGGYIGLMGVIQGIEGNIRTANILRKNLHVQGIYVGSREMFKRMNAFISEHQIHPQISHEFSLDQIQEAFETMKSGGHFGKIVVTI